jgi:hypothetical protein
MARCITTSAVLAGLAPVQFVWHAEDHAFHFLNSGSVSRSECTTVPFEYLADTDETLRDLANLPMGWLAERDGVGMPWKRRRVPMDEID